MMMDTVTVMYLIDFIAIGIKSQNIFTISAARNSTIVMPLGRGINRDDGGDGIGGGHWYPICSSRVS